MKKQSIGEYLSVLRIKNGFKSQRELAKKSGISSATISRLEGNIQFPNPETLKKLSVHFTDVTYEELLERAGYISGIQSELAEIKLLNEIRKYPELYTDLIKEPEKTLSKLNRMWKIMKSN